MPPSALHDAAVGAQHLLERPDSHGRVNQRRHCVVSKKSACTLPGTAPGRACGVELANAVWSNCIDALAAVRTGLPDHPAPAVEKTDHPGHHGAVHAESARELAVGRVAETVQRAEDAELRPLEVRFAKLGVVKADVPGRPELAEARASSVARD